jgi:hypothetical protein
VTGTNFRNNFSGSSCFGAAPAPGARAADPGNIR